MTTDDSGLKLFYRSASYVVTEKNGPSALQQFAQALYADWYERMEADQWEAAGLIEKKQLKENWSQYTAWKPTTMMSHAFRSSRELYLRAAILRLRIASPLATIPSF